MTLSTTARAERGRALVPLAIGLGVLAAGYGGYAAYAGTRVADGTTVAGTSLSGLTGLQAKAKVAELAKAQLAKPITLKVADTTATVDPAQAGLGLDAPATVDRLTGFSLNPVTLWRHVTGSGAALDFSPTVDQTKLTAALASTAKSVALAPKEGVVAFKGAQVVATQPVVGRTLDVAGTAKAITTTWPASTVTALVQTAQPKVPAAEITRITKEFADKVVAGPVKVTAGKSTFEVAPAAITPAVTFTADGAKMAYAIDEKKLVAAVRKVAQDKGIEKEAIDAKVDFSAGSASVTPSQTGVALQDASVAKAVVAALTSPTRTAAVTLTTTKPKLTTEAARATLPKGLISTFTTHFPVNPVRTQNLRVASARLNNTYVAPGETFSLNALLGQRTAAAGYAKAQVIYNGRLAYDYGGGISQVSTTLFNAAFFAGMEFVEYHPHSFYISRYPEGREATISWPDVGHKWTNTTGGGVLIKAWLSGQDITVQMYGTKKWDVEAIKGPRRNVVQPKTIKDDSATCVPQAPGPGFDVTVTRVFKQGGSVVRREDFNTHYIPEDNVVCSRPYTP